MKLPALENPTRYGGLYVFDFGDWTAVGYTAEEIALLLESEKYRDGKVYRIHRATPDGQMELQGVSPERFQLESGLFFIRTDEAAARRDFGELTTSADENPPPCRAFVQLAKCDSVGEAPRQFITALVYPAEYENEMSRWLGEIGFAGGDSVEGGISCATSFYNLSKAVLERRQLATRSSGSSRSRDEVYATVRRAVQR